MIGSAAIDGPPIAFCEERSRPACVLGPRDLAPLMREDSARVSLLFDIDLFTRQQLTRTELWDFW
jgi:hypothetical protein